MFIKKLLSKIFKFEQFDLTHYKNIDGWLTSDEAWGLFETAQKLKPNAVVLEIGSWKGKSTWCIASGLKSGTINCIDPFNGEGESESVVVYEQTRGKVSLLEQFKHNLSGVNKSILIKPQIGLSKDFVEQFQNIDFLFIDGDHSIVGCQFDFENFKNVLNVGGFLAFHDYYPERKELGPTWVIENLVNNDSCFEFYKTFDSLAVFKKV